MAKSTMRWARLRMVWCVLRHRVLILYSTDYQSRTGGKLRTYGCHPHEIVAQLRLMANDIENQGRTT